MVLLAMVADNFKKPFQYNNAFYPFYHHYSDGNEHTNIGKSLLTKAVEAPVESKG